jgi:signal transduction histidine kinase
VCYGLTRLLQDSALDGQRRTEYLNHLNDSAERLTRIVSDVLDLSKIETGRMQVEDIDCDLAGVVTTTFCTFAALGHEPGLEMHCRVADDLPQCVRGDPVRLAVQDTGVGVLADLPPVCASPGW